MYWQLDWEKEQEKKADGQDPWSKPETNEHHSIHGWEVHFRHLIFVPNKKHLLGLESLNIVFSY